MTSCSSWSGALDSNAQLPDVSPKLTIPSAWNDPGRDLRLPTGLITQPSVGNFEIVLGDVNSEIINKWLTSPRKYRWQ